MKKIYLIVCIVFLTKSFGQMTTNHVPFIEVTGESAIEVSPNEVYIDLCLEEYLKDDAKVTLDILETDLKNELAKANILESDLYISEINSVITKTGWFSEEQIATGNYSLKVTDVDKIKEVFKIFEKLDITDASITRATHSDLVSLRKENRIRAIKAAKEKADYLLKAIGSKTGKPLKVVEEKKIEKHFADISSTGNYRAYNSVSKLKSDKKNRAVQFENITIESTIHVVFQIE